MTMTTTVHDAVRPRSAHLPVGCDQSQQGSGSNIGGEGRGHEVLAQGDDEGDEEIVKFQEEDTEPIKVAPSPEMPSQEEIEEHQLDHIPYRSWCRYCLEGHGREDAHTQADERRCLPVISFDYLYMSRRGIFLRAEWQPKEGE